ncbi:SDR family oxidoreductase [Pseudomonas fluorescens]|uniref:SDR family oxidoreductase n=1 Tax=Pseudomonas fluorescens TaxID=294 RepID=UPI000F484A06|nr:SDR family oxidoreductase [Pseudomonas fluorescens]
MLDATTRVQCAERGRIGIRVNSVNLTVTLTPMAQVAWSTPAKRDLTLAAIPLGRFAEWHCRHCSCSAASMIKDVSLPINGGHASRYRFSS